MKFVSILLCFFFISSCTNNRPTGIYICEEIKNDTAKSDNNLSAFALKLIGKNGNCLYNQLEFKGDNTVVVSAMGQTFAMDYTIDGDYIKIKTDKSDLLLKIKDSKTLIGEGFAKGLYKKE